MEKTTEIWLERIENLWKTTFSTQNFVQLSDFLGFLPKRALKANSYHLNGGFPSNHRDPDFHLDATFELHIPHSLEKTRFLRLLSPHEDLKFTSLFAISLLPPFCFSVQI